MLLPIMVKNESVLISSDVESDGDGERTVEGVVMMLGERLVIVMVKGL